MEELRHMFKIWSKQVGMDNYTEEQYRNMTLADIDNNLDLDIMTLYISEQRMKIIFKKYECIKDKIKDYKKQLVEKKKLEISQDISKKLGIIIERLDLLMLSPDAPEGKQIMENAKKEFLELKQ